MLDEQPPEIVVGSELSAAETARAMAPALAWLDELKKEQAAEDAPKLDAAHPAIELAQSFVTPHGKPEAVHGNYYTPPPPELRKPAKV